ncbi:MAG: hypothetical protein ACI9E5_000304 [Candidatus Omnitrophota bacterium]|jgi:hypothetical protein
MKTIFILLLTLSITASLCAEDWEGVFPRSEIDSTWETFIYKDYGFTFRLPAQWHLLKSQKPPVNKQKKLTFTPLKKEHHMHNQELHIIITENFNNYSYEKLFGLEDRPNLIKNYYSSDANITISDVSAKLVYDVDKSGPIVIIPLKNKFIVLVSPKEDFYNVFDAFLSTFKLFN